MRKRGFALLEIIVVVALLVVLAGSSFYFFGPKNNTTTAGLPTEFNAEQQAKQAVQEFDSSTQVGQDALDQAIGGGTGQPTTTTPISTGKTISVKIATTVSATATTTTADPLAGLGGNIYADGILPLGDYKYTTAAPKKGYVYLCNVAQGGGGAQTNGPWIGTSTWNSNEKISVKGSVSWPNASITIAVNGSTRTITTNDLPTVGTTGIFPIESTDPAYQYDGNPNSIEAQNLSFSFPANPTAAAVPSCIYGEVGVMTNGVLLLDAFDAEYRDAEAHEILDSCDGHPHEGGMYHYHSLSSCIPDATVTNIIGWAFDGFPITGPEISPGRYLTTADLDECHGITSPVMLNGKMVTMYHYVMTEDFPYSVSCFHGKSYEPMPSMNGMAGMSMLGQSSSGGSPPAPPQAAITACDGEAAGAACSVSQGPTGTCENIGSYFACKPSN